MAPREPAWSATLLHLRSSGQDSAAPRTPTPSSGSAMPNARSSHPVPGPRKAVAPPASVEQSKGVTPTQANVSPEFYLTAIKGREAACSLGRKGSRSKTVTLPSFGLVAKQMCQSRLASVGPPSPPSLNQWPHASRRCAARASMARTAEATHHLNHSVFDSTGSETAHRAARH